MKTVLLALALLAGGFVAGLFVVLHLERPAPSLPRWKPLATAPHRSSPLAFSGRPSPAPPARGADAASAVSDPSVAPLAAAIDALISPHTGFRQKQALWNQLAKAGALPAAAAVLKQLAQQNPGDAEIATALGETLLREIPGIQQEHGDYNQVAILAMQADQAFNSALDIDPTNWDAQFYKAAALAHWPAGLNRGPEVIQMLTTLAAQQDTMAPEPQFADTYLILGTEYQTEGQAAKAVEAWQEGATRFPTNSALLQKLASAPTAASTP